MSQSECGLHCLVRIPFSHLQGTGHTENARRGGANQFTFNQPSGAFYVGMIERWVGHAALLLWTLPVLCVDRAALLGSGPVLSACICGLPV